jgi:TRAP-type C4-dicarboxylate transport system permease large subunit
MIFSIIWGVLIFVRFLAFAGVSGSFSDWIQSPSACRPTSSCCASSSSTSVLGMFMDGIGMLLLTLPVIFPVMTKLGFDPIWFGIIVVKMVEVGLLTPPVGLNCYVVAAVRPDIPLQADLPRGVAVRPHADLACVGLFVAFPDIVTFLPRLTMSGT